MESKKTTRLHPRNKCDTIYRRYYIYICVVKDTARNKKKKKPKEIGEYDTQRTKRRRKQKHHD